MSICIFNVCIVLSDFQHRILSPTFPFKLALSQALACEFAFASDFIRLYLDDLQKTSQSVFWSYLVLSDMSVRAAGAGNGSPSSGTPGSLEVLSVRGQLDHSVPEQPQPHCTDGCDQL